MILSDKTIKQIGLVSPLVAQSVSHGVSFGLSSAGYDIRIAEDLWMCPGRFQLASTIEHFDMPDDVVGIVHDKSTWARRGLAMQNTVIEPGWRGFLTLELTLHSMRVLRLRRGMGIAQVVFHRIDQPVETPYNGKYQEQEAGPQKARPSK